MKLRKRCRCVMDNDHPFEMEGVCLICGRPREIIGPASTAHTAADDDRGTDGVQTVDGSVYLSDEEFLASLEQK